MFKENVKLLIIEDNFETIDLITKALCKKETNFLLHNLHTKNGYEELLTAGTFDIILCNYNLSFFNELEAFTIKQQGSPEVSFVYYSNSIQLDCVVASIKLGVTNFFDLANTSSISSVINSVVKSNRKTIFKDTIINSKKLEALNLSALDGLNSNIVVINYCGTIVKANESWIAFASKNGAEVKDVSEGANYFKVCEHDKSNENSNGNKALKGIKEVINGVVKEFKLEYSCDLPHEETWFSMRVKKIDAEFDLVLIEHNDISEQKNAQEKLNKTATTLAKTVTNHNTTLDSSLDLICNFNENGEFVYVNSASILTLGYQQSELIGKNFLDFVFIDDIQKTVTAFSEIKSGVSVLLFENRYCHKNGSIIHFFWSVKWDKKNKQAYCIARNETQKKKLEKAVFIEKKRFMDLYAQAPLCMGILKGPNHVYELANPLYLQLIEKQNIIGLSVKELLPELESQGIFKFLDHVYQTGETFTANEMLLQFDFKGNGNLVDTYLTFSYQAHRNIDGEIDGILFFGIDVTEQVMTRKEIEKSEKKYRQIVETAQEGIWMIDKFNKTTFVNSKMTDILEYTPQEMIGKDIFFFMNECDRSKAIELLKKDDEKFFNPFNFKLASKSGNEVWTTISANRLFNDDGSYKGALAMVMDITERKKNEEKLEIQNAELIKAHLELDKFVYSVSHDLRSPLTSVLGLLSFIEEESLEVDTLDHAKMIRTSINRLDEFIKNILNYSRNNRVKLNIEKISIEDTITTIVTSLKNIPEAKDIDFILEFNRSKLFKTDQLRLNTILENLISNAIKHHKKNNSYRFIKITSLFKNKNLHIIIEDNGLGIAPEHHQKIFEMFYRISSETDGTGIGLYIVKDSVENIQGSIELQSEIGVGTTFTIIIKNLKL